MYTCTLIAKCRYLFLQWAIEDRGKNTNTDMTMSIMQQHWFSRIPKGKRLFDYADIVHDDYFIISKIITVIFSLELLQNHPTQLIQMFRSIHFLKKSFTVHHSLDIPLTTEERFE
jgi:hypothetical protein